MTGKVRTEALPSQDPLAMRRVVPESVEKGAAVDTDGHLAYAHGASTSTRP